MERLGGSLDPAPRWGAQGGFRTPPAARCSTYYWSLLNFLLNINMERWPESDRQRLSAIMTQMFELAVNRVTSRNTDMEKLARVAEIMDQQTRLENARLSRDLENRVYEVDCLYEALREYSLDLDRSRARIAQLESDLQMVMDANERLQMQLPDGDIDETESDEEFLAVRRQLFP
jgi:hypothetical protein